MVLRPNLTVIKSNSEESCLTRKFSDKEYYSPLSKDFLSCLDETYHKYVTEDQNTSRSGDKAIHHHIKRFFDYIVSAGTDNTRHLIDTIQQEGYANVKYLEWQFVLDEYRDSIILSKGKEVYSHNIISGLSSFLRYAASEGLWPHKLKISSFKLPPSLAKSLVTHNQAIPSSELVDDVNLSIEKMDLDGHNNEIKNFVSNVIRLANKEIKTKAELVQFTCEYLTETLKQLRLNAEVELRYLIERHDTAIKTAKLHIDAARSINELVLERDKLLCESLQTDNGGRPTWVTESLKEIRSAICSYGKGGLYAYFYHYFDGITPRDCERTKEEFKYQNRHLYHFFSSVCKEVGIKIKEINDDLNLSSRAQVLAQCILYIDTSANETSVRYLQHDCLVTEVIELKSSSDGNRKKRIHTYTDVKNRANEAEYKPLVFTDDPNEKRIDMLVFSDDEKISLSVPAVIEYLQSATKNYRKHTLKKHENRMFLTMNRNNNGKHGGYIPTPLSGGRNTKLFGEIVAEITMGALKVPPNIIRQSTMQLTALLTKDPLRVKEQGRHSRIASASAYLMHLAIQFGHELDIREFQAALEALVTVDTAKFIEFAGVDEESYLQSVEQSKKILQSHFGGAYCSEPTGGEHTEKGKVCDQVHNCPTCPKRRPVLLASTHSIMNTLLWDKALKTAIDKLPKERMKKWQLWIAFNSYALSVFEQPTYEAEYQQALKLSESRINNPYLKVFAL